MNKQATVKRCLPRLLVAGLLVIAISVPGVTLAKEKRVMTVMTQNLYLGSDLTPALEAQTPEEFLGAVALIYGTMLFTDFSTRAEAIAATIDQHRPDIIGLQEVSIWTSVGPGAPATQDFLQILQAELVELDLNYVVAAVSNNAQIGPLPQVLICDFFLACTATLNDRDVILVNADNPDLVVTDSASGLYVAQLVLNTAAGPVSFDRGWAYIDGIFEGRQFRFLDTHLETQAAPPIQEAQGQEFLFGPANTGGTVIAVGDFNSAADGSTTTTYRDLTDHFFRDIWDKNPGVPGLTCCQNSSLTNFPGELTSRIDLILTMRASSRAFGAEVVGDTIFQVVPPLWPSDHAGVIADVRIH